MTPFKTILLTLMGVVVAGLPLLRLTAEISSTAQPQTAPPTEAGIQLCFTTVHFTGTPRELTLHHRGTLLATLPTNAESPWEIELNLPDMPVLELEVQARWDEADSAHAQAIGISVEPEGKEYREAALWAPAHSPILHNICTFSW